MGDVVGLIRDTNIFQRLFQITETVKYKNFHSRYLLSSPQLFICENTKSCNVEHCSISAHFLTKH